MADRKMYEKRTEQLLLPIVEEKGFELVDVEYVREAGNWYLRAYIDKPGGITIDDCEVVSRALGDLLDEKDFISDSYILEVSSPGLGRPLKKDKDYDRAMGDMIELKLYRPVDGIKEYTGILKEYDGEHVTIACGDGTERTFRKKELALIRMAVDF